MQILEKIFSVKNRDGHKVWTVCGFKMKFKQSSYIVTQKMNAIECAISNLENRIVQNYLETEQKWSAQIQNLQEECSSIKANIRVAQLHQSTFGAFKNNHQNQDIVIVCGGPSIVNFKPIDNCIYIAINNCCQYDKVKFDYIFLQELHSDNKKNEFVNNYDNDKCVKFYGIIADKRFSDVYRYGLRQIPQPHTYANNIRRYYLDDKFAYNFAYDLTLEPIGDFGGTVFSAVQFALWTNPRRIYLAGADCSSTKNVFCEKNNACDYNYQIEMWKKLKIFSSDVYPNTEIISINPIGLKGIFNDKYTESFLNEHPEIDKYNVEII